MLIVRGTACPVVGFYTDDGGEVALVRLPLWHPMMRGMPTGHVVAVRLSAGVLVCPD